MDIFPSTKSLPSLIGEDRMPSTGKPGTAWDEEYAYSLGLQAYVWGFPWIYLSQLCWLWTSPGGKQIDDPKHPWASMNSLWNGQVLTTPATSDGGSPNCDTLYSTAWLDLSTGPIVLSVPAVTDRFYSFELANLSSDNFAYVGVLATGSEAGNYLIAGSGWSGDVPADVLDVLGRASTPVAFVLGRTAVTNNSPADLDAVYAIQAQYKLTPLSHWKHANLPPRAQVPIGLDYHDTRGAWATMNRAMTENPPGVWPAIDQLPLLNLFATIGIGPGQKLAVQSDATLRGLARAARDGLALLQKMAVGRGKTVNQWTYPPLDIGRAGMAGDYITRSALQALGGIVANDPAEAVYINTATDSDGQTLTGAESYTILFEGPQSFPPIIEGFHGFWSITLYNTDFNLVPGATAYTVNSYDPKYRARGAGGSMTILVQNEQPQTLGDGVYWLQSPDPAGANSDFTMILRVYVPGPQVSSSQTWQPPSVQRTS